MIIPAITSNISNKDLICLMQSNETYGYCAKHTMLCVDKTFNSLNITNYEGNYTYILRPTGFS